MSHIRRLIAGLTLACCIAAPQANWAQQQNPFCTGPNCDRTRELLKNLCDYIVKEKANFSTIYIGGYYMRDPRGRLRDLWRQAVS